MGLVSASINAVLSLELSRKVQSIRLLWIRKWIRNWANFRRILIHLSGESKNAIRLQIRAILAELQQFKRK